MGNPTQETASTDLPTLMAATTYLMTRHSLQSTGSGRACQAAVTVHSVCHHLEMLLQHPEVQSSSVSYSAYRGLLFEWRTILAKHQGYATSLYELDDDTPAENNHPLPTRQNLH